MASGRGPDCGRKCWIARLAARPRAPERIAVEPAPCSVHRKGGVRCHWPFDRVSQSYEWIENERPDAAVLDIALQDGVSFSLATELVRRRIPFLFYTSWGDPELIPLELREMPFLERPIHFALVAKLLSKMIEGRQVLEVHAQGDLELAED
jgi:DNA-binding NtrC family response regulator